MLLYEHKHVSEEFTQTPASKKHLHNQEPDFYVNQTIPHYGADKGILFYGV